MLDDPLQPLRIGPQPIKLGVNICLSAILTGLIAGLVATILVAV